MMGYGGNYGYGTSMMAGGGWIGLLFMLLFGAVVIGGIVLLVVWVVRSSSGRGSVAGGTLPLAGAAGHDEAVSIAKRRLASGEIDKDQYDGIMSSLGK